MFGACSERATIVREQVILMRAMDFVIPQSLAEVSDKEPTAAHFWATCAVLVLISIATVVIVGRKDLRWVALPAAFFTLANAAIMFVAGPEFEDPHVGPALVLENGPGFETSYHCAVAVAIAAPTIAAVVVAIARVRAKRQAAS